MNSWANENDSLLRIRLTEVKYADAFLQRGSIKFNTPSAWAEYAIDHGDGRGDFYEGTIAFCHYADIEHLCELKNKYTPQVVVGAKYRDLSTEIYRNRILFKDRRSMQLPCFCLYLFKVAALDVPVKEGKQKFKASIPGSYFKDFTDNMTLEEVSHLPEEKQPAMIIIEDYNKFQERLCNALKKIGIKESEILPGIVSYYDFDEYGEYGWKDFGQEYPKELLVKNNRFVNQSEGRIIVKTSNYKILDILKSPIELGDMSDIAQVCKGYFPEGLDIEVDLDVYTCE